MPMVARSLTADARLSGARMERIALRAPRPSEMATTATRAAWAWVAARAHARV